MYPFEQDKVSTHCNINSENLYVVDIVLQAEYHHIVHALFAVEP